MKGIIFNQLEAMVTQNLGPGVWDKLIDESKLQTPNGLFVGPKTYPDEDLYALVGTASRITGTPADDLVTAFGRFLFPVLAKGYPVFLKPGQTAKSFLQSVDRVIHVEVRKLQAESELPAIQYEDPGPGQLVLIYRSKRKLCALATGMIDGVAAHFNERVTHAHPKCLKRGDDHCRIECTFQPAA